MKFTIRLSKNRKLEFSTDMNGLIVDGKEYFADSDGILIYDKTKKLKAERVTCQYSTNTSTVIPALRILGVSYNSYFDQRPVIESQNDITFYWNPSKLAAFYNRYSTDELEYKKREPVIRKAITFLHESAEKRENFLPEELLKKMQEPCELMEFYKGFPIFNATKGMPKLLCLLGIHVGIESIMVSTPMNKYADDIEAVTKSLEQETGLHATRKKNRTVFPRTQKILTALNI